MVEKPSMSSSPYVPTEYWRKAGKTYQQDFSRNSLHPIRRAAFHAQTRVLMKLLKSLAFSSVLEIGCGFGRITKILVETFPGIKLYDALDLSPEQIANAQSYVQSDKVTYYCSTFQDFQLPTGRSYDLVLASEVLLHVPPAEIEAFVHKMVSLSLMHVVHIDWYPKTIPERVDYHNFPHNYEIIYRDLGSRIQRLEVLRITGPVFFLVPMDFGQSVFHVVVS